MSPKVRRPKSLISWWGDDKRIGSVGLSKGGKVDPVQIIKESGLYGNYNEMELYICHENSKQVRKKVVSSIRDSLVSSTYNVHVEWWFDGIVLIKNLVNL